MKLSCNFMNKSAFIFSVQKLPNGFQKYTIAVLRALVLCIRHLYLSQPLRASAHNNTVLFPPVKRYVLNCQPTSAPFLLSALGCLDEMAMLVDGAGRQKKRSLSPWHGCLLSDLLHFITYNPWSEWRSRLVLKQALRGGSLLCKHTYSGIYLNLLCCYWC